MTPYELHNFTIQYYEVTCRDPEAEGWQPRDDNDLWWGYKQMQERLKDRTKWMEKLGNGVYTQWT